MVLLDTGTPGTSREIFSEDADSETGTRKRVLYSAFHGFWQSFTQ